MFIRKVSEYIEMFKEEDIPLHITIQIGEHFARIDDDQPGYDVMLDLFRNLPCALLRYSIDNTINLSLKY